eukprot:GFUD01017242.1.p1 GENE.GFUD01017242.1~~GFUD01017242.1.p1  ORF type:complete len:340 (-),score=89.84 GFUD01017242.1:39-1058(-)
MGSEKFCLRWNDFESNISSAFRELREDKDFFDVTLACDDEQIQAHKVILSACSQFFRNILRRNPHQHPLLYLKGVKFTDLQSVLNFMYHGEVNVAQEELNSFLSVAEDLKVKGLTQNQSGTQKKESNSRPKSPPLLKSAPRVPDRDNIPPPKRPRPPPTSSTISHTATDDDDIQEVVPVKTEPKEVHPTPQPQPIAPPPQQFYSPQLPTQALAPADDQLVEYQDESYDDYGEYAGDHQGYEGGHVDGQGADGTKVLATSHGEIDEHMEALIQKQPEGGYQCVKCGYGNIKKSNMKKHVETHIETPGYQCTFCYKQFKTKNSLNTHTSVNHREEKRNLSF